MSGKCKYCGEYRGKYDLCSSCYNLSKEGKLVQTRYGWKMVLPGQIVENDLAYIYDLRDPFLTYNEQRFYRAILSVLPDGCSLFPQVALSSVIRRTDNPEYQGELYRVIDFLITDTKFKPLVFIEINDETHNEPNRKERDRKVKRICEEAGIPIITCWTSMGINPSWIKSQIEMAIAKRQARERVPHEYKKIIGNPIVEPAQPVSEIPESIPIPKKAEPIPVPKAAKPELEHKPRYPLRHRSVAALLAIFFGFVGVHCFYVKRPLSAMRFIIPLTMLAWLYTKGETFLAEMMYLLVFIAINYLVDFIAIIGRKFKDGAGRQLI